MEREGWPPLDFTDARYLGLRHSSGELPAWDDLTTGVPAALAEAPAAAALARRLAALVGCRAATLAPSTLHLALDWFASGAATQGTAILCDAGVYPVTRWAIERAGARGVPTGWFAHFAPGALARAIAHVRERRLRPVVVTDGYCPGCARAAPLVAFAALARPAGGLLVVDDTQALGLCGARSGDQPGGGGSLRAAGLDGEGVVWFASLAKAFGAPMAALAGDDATVRRFQAESETRVHTSPPCAAVIAAASCALERNHVEGARLRGRLAARVRRFRARLRAAGLAATGDDHPVQLLAPIAGVAPAALFTALSRRGVRTVPLRSRCRGGAAVGFIITARHDEEQIDGAVGVLARTVDLLRGDAAPAGAEEEGGTRSCREEWI